LHAINFTGAVAQHDARVCGMLPPVTVTSSGKAPLGEDGWILDTLIVLPHIDEVAKSFVIAEVGTSNNGCH
jgi:hypothetical protein